MGLSFHRWHCLSVGLLRLRWGRCGQVQSYEPAWLLYCLARRLPEGGAANARLLAVPAAVAAVLGAGLFARRLQQEKRQLKPCAPLHHCQKLEPEHQE